MKILNYLLKKLLAGKVPDRYIKILRTGALASAAVVFILFSVFFSFRNIILNSFMNNKIQAFRKNHQNVYLRIAKARFNGFSRIDIENIRFQVKEKDPLLDIQSCSVNLFFWRMLLGQARPKHIELNEATINIYAGDKGNNYSELFIKSSKNKKASAKVSGYSGKVGYSLDLFFNRLPNSLKLNNFTIHSDIKNIQQKFILPQLLIKGLKFKTVVRIGNQENQSPFYLEGSIKRRKKQLAFIIYPMQRHETIHIPFIDKQWGAMVDFKAVEITLKDNGTYRDRLNLKGLFSVKGLTINHPRLAAETVHLPKITVNFVLNLGRDYFEFADSTHVTLNRFSFSPYLKLITNPSKQLIFRVKTNRFNAADFFASLPSELFDKLAGIKTSGELSYDMHLFIDFSSPEDLRLESKLEKYDFKIKKFGAVNFSAMNFPFHYTAYEKNQPMRSFIVGPENPDFRTLDQISSYIKEAVLASEDDSFFWHKGFSLGPFKESIAANIKANKFVRGASTISMQLVKNLYLKKQKTIARKFEEIIITWLIEANRLVTKDRMYEIYLNIIEWGPMVYGVNEAARFYFNKDAAEITLSEAIFMASIIPRPKKFIYFFDNERNLRPWVNSYYKDISYKMLLRSKITQQEYDDLSPFIQLKGPAGLFLKGKEETSIDPLWQDEEIQ